MIPPTFNHNSYTATVFPTCKTAACGDLNHPGNQHFAEWLFLLPSVQMKTQDFSKVFKNQKNVLPYL